MHRGGFLPRLAGRSAWYRGGGGPRAAEEGWRWPGWRAWEPRRKTLPRTRAGSTARRTEPGGDEQAARAPSWRKLPFRAQYLDDDQLPAATMRTACRRGSRDAGLGRRGQRVRGAARRGVEQRAGPCELPATGVAPEAVVTHLGATGREHVLEEATDEPHGRQGRAAQALRVVVAMAERHLAILARYMGPWRREMSATCRIETSGGTMEGALETGVGDRAAVVGEAVRET